MKTTFQRMEIMRTAASASVLAMAAMAMPAFGQDAQEAAEDSGDIVVTGQFLNTGASSATKLDIPVLDTPFSVASYNDEFLKAIETTSVSDLYRYMTGVQRAGNTGYDVTIRGFKNGGADRNSFMTDGLPGLSVRFGSPPTIGVESVEIVKGPASVLYGQAQPGGFINIITKKPKNSPRYEVSLKGTSGLGPLDRNKSIIGAIDATGPIDGEGKFLYRIVAEIAEARGFRDYSYEKPFYVAPSLAWNIGPDTKLTLLGEYRKTRTHYTNNLAAPARDVSLITDPSINYQSPTDYQTENGLVGTVLFEHAFSNAFKFNLAYRYVDHFDSAFGYDNLAVRQGTTKMTRRARGQENIRTYGFLDANVTADFDTLGIGHKLILGGTIGKETSNFKRLQFYNAPANTTGTNPLSLDIDLFDPVQNAQPLSFYPLCNIGAAAGTTIAACSAAGSNLTWQDSQQKSKGVYISDLITLHDMVKVMVGLRYANEREDTTELRVAGVPARTKQGDAWLPLAGIMFQPAKNISIYGSYSTSYVPVAPNVQDNFGQNNFPATKANSIEFGVKAELFDRKLNVTTAYFDIKKTDTLNTFACLTAAQLAAQNIAIPAGATIATGNCSAPIGSERAKGFEIEISANLVEGWTLSAGYSHTEARVSASNIAVQNGARLTNAPDDTFNLWSRYDFQGGALKGLGFGLGIAHTGLRVGYLPVATLPAGIPSREAELLPMPGFTIVDVGLYYKASDNLNLTFKISNLFDKRFIESTGFSGDIQMLPGQPRLATLSARYEF